MEPKMTTQTPGSAKIFTFPPRGRYALRMQHDGSVVAANVQLPRGVTLVTGGSGWYHDEAIQDALKAEQTRKN
jgi:Protein of unknown function (DUF2735)